MAIARVTLAALLLGAAACAGEDGPDVRIDSFELERAEPPADDRGGLVQVGPKSALHFRWKASGDVRRIELTANEKTIASFSGENPGAASERCASTECSTWKIGEVDYRLVAWDGAGRTDSRSLRLRVAEQGLQILRFTSDPESIDPGATVTLAWTTAGAEQARVSATPIGGGETRQLGTFADAAARSGSVVDSGLSVSTLYRLEVEDAEGKTAAAEISVPLRGEAFLTSIAADPPQAAVGEPVTLSWTSVGLERLTILRDDAGETIDDVAEAELAAGSRTVKITRDTSFAFVGISRDGEVITERCDDAGCADARLVVAIHPGPAVLSFTADEREIASGASTTIRWEVTQADEVVITWAGTSGSGELPVAPADVSALVQPADSTRYTLVASGGGRNASRQLLLGVRPDVAIEGPAAVRPGESFAIDWTTKGATQLELRVDGSLVPLGDAPIAAGSVTIDVDSAAAPGSSLDVELTARDDETPRRAGVASLRVEVRQ